MIKRSLLFFFLLGFIVQVSFGQVRLRGELLHDYDVQVGQTIEGQIVLENLDDVDREVKLYQRDYQFNHDNSSEYPKTSTIERSNGPWISIFQDQLRIQPGETKVVPYMLTVPSTESVGSFWSVIMVEPISPLTADKNGNIGVSIKTRYAVQIATHIRSGQINKSMEVLGYDLSYGEEGLNVDVASKNTGNIAYRSKVDVSIYDLNGNLVKDWNTDDSYLYPGSSSTVRFKAGDVEPGDYQVIVVYDTGDDDVYGAKYDLTIRE